MDKVIGMKFDGGKIDYSLVPPLSDEEVAKVLTIGANKYERDNWRHVDNANIRYYAAMMRHIKDWRKGNKVDEETGCQHLAHAICCLIFLLEKDLEAVQANIVSKSNKTKD